MKKIVLKRNRTELKILLSYFIVTIFSLSTLILISTYVYKNIEKEVLTSSKLRIEMVKSSFDNQFDDIMRIYQEVLLNKNLISLSNIKPRTTDYYFRINQFLKEPKVRYTYDNNLNYYIYVRNGDTIIKDASALTRIDYYNNYIDSKVLSCEEWSQNYFDVKSRKIEKTVMIDALGNYRNVVSFIYPIHNSKLKAPPIVFVVNLYEDVFTNMCNAIENLAYTNFFIYSKNNEVLVSAKESEYIDITRFPRSNDVEICVDNKTVFLTTWSKRNDYIYIIQIEKKLFWSKIYWLKAFLYICMLVYLIVSIMLVSVLAHKNYKPIYDLIRLMGLEELIYGKDEFAVIKENIISTYEERSKIENNIFNLKKTSIVLALAAYLVRNIDINSLKKVASGIYNDFHDGSFFVVTIKIEETDKSMDTDLDEEMKQYIINNVLLEMFGENGNVRSTYIDNKNVFVVSADEEFYEERTRHIICTTREFIKENFKFDFVASVSNLTKGFENMPDAYDQTMSALEYRMFLDVRDLIFYSNIKETQFEKTYKYPLEFEEQLIKTICAGDYEEIKKMIDRLFIINFSERRMNIESVRLMVFDLLATVVKSLQQIEECSEDLIDSIYNKMQDIDYYDVDKFKQFILKILEIISDSIDISDNKIIKESMSIVKKEYTNSELNNDLIAERLSVNPKYLSRLFNLYSNQGLPEHIKELRINEAKRLILAGVKMEEVASRVGFTNSRSFYRVFKQRVGMTPTEYKKSNTEY